MQVNVNDTERFKAVRFLGDELLQVDDSSPAVFYLDHAARPEDLISAAYSRVRRVRQLLNMLVALPVDEEVSVAHMAGLLLEIIEPAQELLTVAHARIRGAGHV